MAAKRLKLWTKKMLPRLPRALDGALVEGLYRVGLAPLPYRTFARCGRPLVVEAGPFAGMEYVPQALGSALYPKIFGTYEKELFEIIEQIITQPYDRLLNIGSAEGYYAVGLTRRMAELEALCFDIDDDAPTLLAKVAAKNGVGDRVRFVGEANSAVLEDSLAAARAPLIVCDCEGCENEVLDPQRTASLARSAILVETHDCHFPGTSDRIRQRFEQSHRIETIVSVPRRAEELEARFKLTALEAEAVMNECRAPDQSWFWMIPEQS